MDYGNDDERIVSGSKGDACVNQWILGPSLFCKGRCLPLEVNAPTGDPGYRFDEQPEYPKQFQLPVLTGYGNVSHDNFTN
jgi:hypothetical protein